MTNTIEGTLNTKTKIWHLLLVFAISIFICFFSYIWIIPLIYWSVYRECAKSARIEALPINIFIVE